MGLDKCGAILPRGRKKDQVAMRKGKQGQATLLVLLVAVGACAGQEKALVEGALHAAKELGVGEFLGDVKQTMLNLKSGRRNEEMSLEESKELFAQAMRCLSDIDNEYSSLHVNTDGFIRCKTFHVAIMSVLARNIADLACTRKIADEERNLLIDELLVDAKKVKDELSDSDSDCVALETLAYELVRFHRNVGEKKEKEKECEELKNELEKAREEVRQKKRDIEKEAAKIRRKRMRENSVLGKKEEREKEEENIQQLEDEYEKSKSKYNEDVNKYRNEKKCGNDISIMY